MSKVKVLAVVFVFFTVLNLTGCGYYDENYDLTQDVYITPTPQDLKETSDYYIYRFRDHMTGVNYLVFKSTYGGGICPRYNADGTVYVTDENGKSIDGYLSSLDIENIPDIDELETLE